MMVICGIFFRAINNLDFFAIDLLWFTTALHDSLLSHDLVDKILGFGYIMR